MGHGLARGGAGEVMTGVTTPPRGAGKMPAFQRALHRPTLISCSLVQDISVCGLGGVGVPP